MMDVKPIEVQGYRFVATHVALPKTNLLSISNDIGYIMCGALDITLLREQLADRGIIAARAVGVRTMQELLDGEVESCTQGAEAIGILPGMSMRDALAKIGAAEAQSKP
ncbi:YunC family protein [Alicyclobacillus fastidiosus]|uniref:DUF1805 domain-containing protein n=1 Tax=Alicyclobacillus fastidiosus TaxID=392011 RepID=A0ABV5ADW3_9BACL|nr:DUF1805 domain-containing protein [Alicyclobacillus fastidiosus]WEH08533.1 DUF1805 domain-containing protein [Alicyclobacillus fastidiosus]